jgi:RND family efflux transporter MFP subunit
MVTMNSNMMPKKPLYLAFAMIALAGLAACKPTNSASQDPRLLKRLVEVATVAPANPTAESFTGVVGARVESDLGFRVPGKVIDRLVDTGQIVKQGQPLMRIDPTDYADALLARKANVAAARAHWIQTAADERRYRGLVTSGAVSQSAYDQEKAAADSAQADLEAAEQQERVAENQNHYTVLEADADGTVMATLAEPGQVVAAGQVVVRLAHAGPREAIVNLPETLRPAIGSTVTASLYGDSVRVPAYLRQLSDAADPRTRTFEARYVMSDLGANAPLGGTVTVTLKNSRGPGLFGVPLGAIDDEGQGPGVWLVDPKKLTVSYRVVEVHSLGAEVAEVSGDLAQGETVVATGGHFLHQGEPVRIARFQAAMQ